MKESNIKQVYQGSFKNLKMFFIGFIVISFLIAFIVGGFVLGSKREPTVINQTQPTCGTCPQYAPLGGDFCKGGIVIPGVKDECGCQFPPTCKR